MSNGIKNYYELVQKPWGKMFYDIVFKQLNLDSAPTLKILDFGSGFGITANYYAKFHDVVAIEPDVDMIAHRFCENEYTQITGSSNELERYNGVFDVVICHNVLEYTPEPRKFLTKLVRTLKPGGIVSVIKHNRNGHIMSSAIFEENPQKALFLLGNKDIDNATAFGYRFLYTNEDIIDWGKEENLVVEKILGVRSFFALTQNNNIKFDEDWYRNMLKLEIDVCEIEEFKQIAFFNHLIFKKERL